jgi:predicted nucleic acid-binding protein
VTGNRCLVVPEYRFAAGTELALSKKGLRRPFAFFLIKNKHSKVPAARQRKVAGRAHAQRPALLSVPDVPLIDGLLAATAKVHGLTLVTRNIDDIARTGVSVLHPVGSPA